MLIRADLQVPYFWQRASAPDLPRQDSSDFWCVESYLLFYLCTLPASPGALVLLRGLWGSLIYGLARSWKKYPVAELCFWRAFKFDWPRWRRKYFNCSSSAVRGLSLFWNGSWIKWPSIRPQTGVEAFSGSFGWALTLPGCCPVRLVPQFSLLCWGMLSYMLLFNMLSLTWIGRGIQLNTQIAF